MHLAQPSGKVNGGSREPRGRIHAAETGAWFRGVGIDPSECDHDRQTYTDLIDMQISTRTYSAELPALSRRLFQIMPKDQ